MSDGGRKEQRSEGALGDRRTYVSSSMLTLLWRRRELTSVTLATFSIIPAACPSTNEKALQPNQRLPPKEK